MAAKPDVRTDRPILVTGLPRSGTSIVAGSLKRCGAWLGRTVGRGHSNPKGFFENRTLREQVNKGILEALGSDPLGVSSLPDSNREVAATGRGAVVGSCIDHSDPQTKNTPRTSHTTTLSPFSKSKHVIE